MIRVLLFTLILCGGACSLLAADPADQFSMAYRACEDAGKLEQGNNNQEALKKYHFAESLLLEVSKNNPTWNKDVIEYRLKKVREGLDRLENMPVTPPVEAAQDSSTASAEQSSPGGGSGGPSITITPPSRTSNSSASGASAGELRRLRRQISDLKEKLQQSEDALKSQRVREKDLESEEWVKKRAELDKELQTTKDQVATLKDQLHQRDSWANDLKDLQKKLDDAVADKLAAEEQYQEKEKKGSEMSTQLMSQLEDARKKLIAESDSTKKYEELSGEVEKQKGLINQLKANLEHSEQVSKESSEKNTALQKQVAETAEKLSLAQNQAKELAPLHQKIKELQDQSTQFKQQNKNANEKIALLQQAAQQVGAASGKREANLRADLQVLEEERQGIAEKAEQLAKAAAEAGKLERFKTEAESLKKTVADLQDRLSVADKNAAKARSEAETSAQAAKLAQENLVKNSKMHEADSYALEEERQNLIAKLEDASKKIGELGKQAADINPLKKEIEQLKDQLTSNAKELGQAKAQLAEAAQSATIQQAETQRRELAAQSLKEMLEQQNASLQEQLKGTLARMASLVDHGQDASALQEQLKKLQDQMDQNAKNFSDSQRQLAGLSKNRPEQEKALLEKEKALAEAKSDAEKLRSDLTAANQKVASLQQQAVQGEDRLHQLQDQLAELSKKEANRDKASADLQKEEAVLRAELADAQQKYAELKSKEGSGSKQLKELQEELSAKTSELALLKKRKGKNGTDVKIAEENTLLRGIVLREVKDEAKRAQARRLIDEEMKHLNVQSQTLSEQITVLSSPAIALTPEERALFKDGQLEVSDEAPEKMEASISAPIFKAPEKQGSSTNPTEAQETHPSEKKEVSEGIPWQGKFKEYLALAKEQFDKQDFIHAEGSFQEALKLSPNDYFALSNLGVVEFQLGKMGEAEDLLKKAASQNNSSSFALTTLGIVHYRQGRLSDAEKTLRKAISINDQDFTAHNYLGIVLAASGNGKAGESEIMKALEINSDYADAHFNLAVIYATGKPPAKMMAKLHYSKAVQLGAPPDPSLERLVQ